MEKIKLVPKRESYLSFALGLLLYLAILFGTAKYDFFDASVSIASIVWVFFLIFMLLTSLYFLFQRNNLILDEKGISQTGNRPFACTWEEIEEVKPHFIMPQEFISLMVKTKRDQKSKWVHLHVRHYSAGADVLVNFMRDMIKEPADQRKYMMHNLDWTLAG